MTENPRTPTHILIHRYVPGTGPQEGTAEMDAEMKIWAELDRELRSTGTLVGAYALHDTTTTLGEQFPEHEEIVFAIHAVAAGSHAEAEEIAGRMPHLGYGSTEVRPLMDLQLP